MVSTNAKLMIVVKSFIGLYKTIESFSRSSRNVVLTMDMIRACGTLAAGAFEASEWRRLDIFGLFVHVHVH